MKSIFLGLSILLLASTAGADSFWDHNGSTVRLQDNGSERIFTYEYPSVKMQNAGVSQGDILFSGIKKAINIMVPHTFFQNTAAPVFLTR